MGIPFHIYGHNNKFHLEYSLLGAVVHPSHSYISMMQQLGRYDWGFIGPGVECENQTKDAVKSKSFDVWNSAMHNHSDEQWQAMLDMHATAPFRLLRAYYPWLKAKVLR